MGNVYYYRIRAKRTVNDATHSAWVYPSVAND